MKEIGEESCFRSPEKVTVNSREPRINSENERRNACCKGTLRGGVFEEERKRNFSSEECFGKIIWLCHISL